jgi:hypothetical protein
MITPTTLQALKALCQGQIEHCLPLNESRDCQWSCCTYTDSWILLLPGEYESAAALGYDMSGYEILDDDYFGGKKVVPRSRGCCMTPKTGLNNYKPIDCALYPLWPTLSADGTRVVIAGSLCPIIKKSLSLEAHMARVAAVVDHLAADADAMHFFANAEMKGYAVYGTLPAPSPAKKEEALS